ncbi:hypothetical protein LEP1GSC073_2442 [Leptospira noguchii str. Cascata]|nr:hypothetical protein LEP1GSC073_2442 [Leptospira noguchii str. Cascata]
MKIPKVWNVSSSSIEFFYLQKFFKNMSSYNRVFKKLILYQFLL